MATLKTILDSVCDDDILERGSSYATNTKPEYNRFLRHANKALEDIMSQGNWGKLKKRHTVTVIDGTTLYDLPDDFYSMLNDTGNTETGIRNVELPASDSRVSDSDTYNTNFEMGRILGDQIELIDVPAGDFTFMYIGTNPVQPAVYTTTSEFTSDDDEWLLSDELLKRGILWRWRKAENHPDWQIDLQDFNNYLASQKGRDTGARVINATPATKYKHIPFWAKEIN